MPTSELRLVKRCAEYLTKEEIKRIPPYTRGIYVLFKYKTAQKKYDVVYVGLAAGQKGSIRGRLITHLNSPKKRNLWTHFSAFEVWDNIQDSEITELEGLFRHIYRKDTNANRLNKQKGFGKLKKIIKSTKENGWLNGKKAKTGIKNERPLHGVFPGGKVIYASYKGKDYKAWIKANGGVKFKGVIYDSPSTAGSAARGGKATNGWRFWKYKNKQGELVYIDTLQIINP